MTMSMITRAVVTAGLLWIAPALGQPAQDDHAAHHPDTGTVAQQQPTQPTAPPAAGMGPGMMGGNMMGGNAAAGTMMGGAMMGQGQAGPSGMMQMMNMMAAQLGQHVEGRLAFIKAELKITDAQAAQWNAFADAARSNANSMSEMRKSMMSGQSALSTLPDRLAIEDKAVTAHLAALKKTEEAVAKLYAVLTDDQKKIADTIIVGPMGMPMGMM
jgi:hypothetical protein